MMMIMNILISLSGIILTERREEILEQEKEKKD